ncbi:hypothetical protein HMPREF0290_1360 [Corynebacterium efficiens YS-314]|uniref:DUF4185 domain-containing protein n=1 Tax=Corynebacterium efficiens (strain DSM 44549 / YS-314 / AJ 12310 / JCM 11189 / NBRC 100395) TaxID=196164 RepID=Q8FQL7_COREF|nr:DUF4185 domain-containing protein [Corynebacterium efficiens]EEW50032.1 hypothetical protein HMPREF0290_1360 [Corynebacterium efficiens YS-314]BAC17912.1 conserved hypothetical protein [Corynebacterium efficiens YS-314]
MSKSVRALTLIVTGALTCAALSPGALAQSAFSSGSSGSTGSSSASGSSGGGNPTNPATPWAEDISEGLVVNLIGDLLGPGISNHVGVMTGDLGTMTRLGDGGEFAIIFGDSFRGATFGQGDWLSPIGVVAEMDADGRIVIKRPLNDGWRVEQLVNYSHNDRGLTLLPSDVMNINGNLYMQAMWNEGVGNVLYTQIWESADQGRKWRSIATIPTSYLGGKANLITWEYDQANDWVYMMSSEFKRNDDVYLTRFRPYEIDDRTKWQHYSLNSDGTGSWGSRYTPILSDRVKAGEMSLRHIEGHWVLAMFNAETMAIEVRISEEIERDWNEITPANVVVSGFGGWGAEQSPSNFTQLYGGYITPGSTLGNMDLVVSQWNTSNNSRYMSTQFNVKGLDKFFGITAPEASNARSMMRTLDAPADTVGNQDVIEVEQVEVTPAPEVELAESLTDITIVPLEESTD